MNILALTKYSYEGPSSRYRFYNYQKKFSENGINMRIIPFFSKSYFTANNFLKKIFIVVIAYLYRLFILLNVLIFSKKYEVILIEYELFPYFPAFFEYFLKTRNIKYIVDYDDAIFHKYDMHKNKLIYFFLNKKIAKVMKNAYCVIVCNPYLESYAKKRNNNLFRLPTVVLLDNYKKELLNFEKNNDTFIIGWIGSRTTSVYILKILPVIKKVITKYKNIEFHLVGFDKGLLSEKDLDRYHLNIIPWKEENEIKNILNFDIGIMPLDNNPWSQGKCGFKLIQYMSCKKSVIASPVGINCSLIENDINGYLAESNDSWFNAFEKLYLDKKLRKKMEKNNFNKVLQSFNYNMTSKTYIELIKSKDNVCQK